MFLDLRFQSVQGQISQRRRDGYRLNYIRAKRADTSLAWINSIFLVMNLLILLRVFISLQKLGLTSTILRIKRVMCRLWQAVFGRLSGVVPRRTPHGFDAVLTF